jgi:adenylate cyclase
VGDAVVALFEAKDMALNAIRCGIEIHKALETFNAQNPDQPPLRLGIGINTGEVILGSIGSESRRDFTAIGSHVNLSARLCSLAGPGEILIGEATYQEVRDFVAAEKMEPQQVKGFTDPIQVYRIARPRA